MRNYQNLEAWKSAMQLIKQVYILTKAFPKEELYTLTSQARRAAVSIAANIAEGMGRQYKRDTVQFLHIARGSIYELETLLNIAALIDLLEESKLRELISLVDNTAKLLSGLINYNEKAILK